MIRFSQEPLLNHTFYRAKENIKVEILKFSEPPKRSSRSNTRKKGGVMPLLSVVAAVAIVGGMSSTLAGTITLNSNTSVEFGQGVVTAAACDTSMAVFPTAEYDTSSAGSFKVSQIRIEGVGLNSGTNGDGCKNKRLTVRAYPLNSNTPLEWASGSTSIVLDFPNTETLTAGADSISRGSQTFTLGSASTGYNTALGAVTEASGLSFTISGLNISSTVVRFTIESSNKPL